MAGSIRRSARAVAGIVAVAVFASSCGGSGDNDASPTASMHERHEEGIDQTIEIEARDTKFVPDEITVEAGQTVKLVLKNNDAGTDHDLEAEGLMVRVVSGGAGSEHGEHGGGGTLAVHAAAGEGSSVVFVADTPGTYEIYCTVDGHRDAGMVGTIKVV